MLITLKDTVNTTSFVADMIAKEFANSRFKLSVEVKGQRVIKLRNIRLNEKKLYCGNHPNACQNPFGSPPRMGNYLEGADWVDFNDRLNDLFDHYDWSARIRSSVCEIRDGNLRRINYGSHMRGNFWQWDQSGSESDFADYVGKTAPPSTYPFGTPGEYLRGMWC